MSIGSGGNGVPAIARAEHIGSDAGENIEAKRVGNYGWDGANWQRMDAGLPAHDFIGVTPGTTSDVYAYKSGGSGGTLVATLTITFSDSTKSIIQSIART